MSEYLLRLNYSQDYAGGFINIEDVSTTTAVNLLAVQRIYCSQLDHSTLAFESDAARTMAVLLLSGRTGYTVTVV